MTVLDVTTLAPQYAFATVTDLDAQEGLRDEPVLTGTRFP